MLDLPAEKFHSLGALLSGAKSVFLAGHENPDADAIASVLSLHHALKRKGIATTPYLPDLPPKRFGFLPGFFEIKNELDLSESPDLLICLDCGDFKRVRISQDFPEEKIITIDHHLQAGQRGFLKIIQPEFSSTSEIIYFLLKEMQIPIDKDIATCLMAGIIADSGGFQYISTSSETFKVAADLILKGVLLEKIMFSALFPEKPLNILKVWGRVLSRVQIDKNMGFAYSWVSFDDLEEYRIDIANLAGIASVLSAMPGINLSLFLMEYEKGKIRGSLRTENLAKGISSKIDIASLAESLAGGGHPYASGFKQDGSIEEVLGKVYKLIERQLSIK